MSNTNIEEEVFENRVARNLQNGPGPELEQQVDSRNNMEAKDASQKYYKRKGTSTLGGFNELQMYKDGVNPQVREDGSYVLPNQYRNSGTGVMFGFDPVSGKKIEDVSAGPAYMAPLRVVGGGFHDMARGGVELGLDIAEGVGVDTGQARTNFEAYKEPEWLGKSSGQIEDIGRTLAQFMTGYGAVGKGLAQAGMKQGFKKEMAASAVAGQTFDPAEGNLMTLLNENGMLPETMRYLDSKMSTEEMGEFHGRMALLLEEGGLGGGIAAVGKMMRAVGKNYKNYGNTMIKDGVMMYNKATGSLNHPTLGAQGTEILQQNQALDGLTNVARGMQINNATSEQFMAEADKVGVDVNVAKKAWNNASKSKLDSMAGFVTQPSPGPIARQKGHIKLGEAADIGDFNKVMDVESMDKMFQKQITRGNIQRAEYDDVVKPTINRLKEVGENKVTPDQMVRYMDLSRPEFKTITKTDDAKFEQYIHRPSDNTLVLDYKEHLFTARNDKFEGERGYKNKAHFSEPFVKGIARTSLMGQSAGPGQLKNGKIYIQEMQSDSASAARTWGEWTDEDVQTKVVDVMDTWDMETPIIPELEKMFGKPRNPSQRGQIDRLAEEIESRMEYNQPINFAMMRMHLATPSAFNDEKAWVRQTIRPVIEDAVVQGVDKIELASSDIINKRWQGNAPSDKYEKGYPKILKQYFKGIGVPEKDIHMPKKSSDSFWVKLPKDVMEGTKKLPQYSVAGSAPVTMKFGEEDDK